MHPHNLHLNLTPDTPLPPQHTVEFLPVSITKEAGKAPSKSIPPSKPPLPVGSSFAPNAAQPDPRSGSAGQPATTHSQCTQASFGQAESTLSYSQGGSDLDEDGDSLGETSLVSQIPGMQSQQLQSQWQEQSQVPLRSQAEEGVSTGVVAAWRYAVKLERLPGRTPEVCCMVGLMCGVEWGVTRYRISWVGSHVLR